MKIQKLNFASIISFYCQLQRSIILGWVVFAPPKNENVKVLTSGTENVISVGNVLFTKALVWTLTNITDILLKGGMKTELFREESMNR